MFPEGDNVVKSVFCGRAVVEHQQNTGDGEGEEHKKGESPHAPGIAQLYTAFLEFDGVEVEKDISRYHGGAVSSVTGRSVAKDGFPDLGVCNVFDKALFFRHILPLFFAHYVSDFNKRFGVLPPVLSRSERFLSCPPRYAPRGLRVIFISLQWSGGGAFKVYSIHIVSTAVTGTFEFRFSR